MNVLGMGPMEFLVIAALAFFLLGPKKMAEAGKTFGKVMKEFRAQRDELTSMIMDAADTDPKDSDRPSGRPRYTPPSPAGSVAFNDKTTAAETGESDVSERDPAGGSARDEAVTPDISAPADPARPFAPPASQDSAARLSGTNTAPPDTLADDGGTQSTTAPSSQINSGAE